MVRELTGEEKAQGERVNGRKPVVRELTGEEKARGERVKRRSPW